MDLYQELNLEPVKSEPDVWVSRIVLLERLTPSPIFIRDIPLSRGLNIIWAEEAEDESSEPNITGHSAGKTTFCRLFRYVLGERTFGSKAAIELIREAFPEGYIAAELHVLGRKWAVRRPFISGRSFIKEDATIEDLLQSRGQPVSQEPYPIEIGLESLLDKLETGQIVQTGEPIQWSHILAWCTRDQEARFQNIHDWRSSRSGADKLSFRFPKAGPLFVMRAVLGLFLPDELKAEEKLAELQKDKDSLNKEIEDKRREPQFRVSLYEHELRQRLKHKLSEESNIDSMPFQSDELFSEDLARLTGTTLGNLRESIKKKELEEQALQAQIDDLGADLEMHKRMIDQYESLFPLDGSAKLELRAEALERQKQRAEIEEVRNRECPLGDVIFNDCSYIQDRQRILQITELQDARAMKRAEAKRAEEIQKIEEKKAALQKDRERIEEERKNIRKKRAALMAQIQKQQDLMSDIARTRDELVTWIEKRDKPGGYEELDSLRRQLKLVEKDSEKFERELGAQIRQHDENRKRLTAIFSRAVRSVLSSKEYDGLVSLDNRELAFRITRGPAMSGEAVGTLAVLLADITALIYNTVSNKGHLPGFLLHDSPREADLGIQIYRSYFRFVASLHEHFNGAESCPFQYIITTTTAPPEELQIEKYVKLRLNASTPEGLLLHRNVAAQAEIPRQLSIF